MEQEVWKDIQGYEGYYQISNLGRCKSLAKTVRGRRGALAERILKPQFNGHYYHLRLSKDSICMMHLLHRLIATAFIPNPKNLPVVNHLDGDKLNNKVSNLEWTTIGDNTRHAINELGIVLGGEKHHAAKLTEKKVKKIIELANTGLSHSKIAKMFSVSRPNISYIARGATWKHVK